MGCRLCRGDRELISQGSVAVCAQCIARLAALLVEAPVEQLVPLWRWPGRVDERVRVAGVAIARAVWGEASAASTPGGGSTMLRTEYSTSGLERIGDIPHDGYRHTTTRDRVPGQDRRTRRLAHRFIGLFVEQLEAAEPVPPWDRLVAFDTALRASAPDLPLPSSEERRAAAAFTLAALFVACDDVAAAIRLGRGLIAVTPPKAWPEIARRLFAE